MKVEQIIPIVRELETDGDLSNPNTRATIRDTIMQIGYDEQPIAFPGEPMPDEEPEEYFRVITPVTVREGHTDVQPIQPVAPDYSHRKPILTMNEELTNALETEIKDVAEIIALVADKLSDGFQVMDLTVGFKIAPVIIDMIKNADEALGEGKHLTAIQICELIILAAQTAKEKFTAAE